MQLTVHDGEATRTFILFNDKAEELAGVKSDAIASEAMSAEDLTQRPSQNRFCFVVSGDGSPMSFCAMVSEVAPKNLRL